MEAELARTHKGLVSAFARFIVAPGLVTREIGRTLGQAQHVRLIADYKGNPVNAADASRVIEWAAAFIQKVGQVFHLDVDSKP